VFVAVHVRPLALISTYGAMYWFSPQASEGDPTVGSSGTNVHCGVVPELGAIPPPGPYSEPSGSFPKGQVPRQLEKADLLNVIDELAPGERVGIGCWWPANIPVAHGWGPANDQSV
jgi:hypothetical protein